MNEKELKVSHEVRQVDAHDVLVVYVQGSVDAHTFNAFQEQITALTVRGPQRLLLNFQGLEYINSTGLGFLLGLSRQIGEQNGKLVIANMSDKIHHIFDLLGISHLMGTFAEERQALAALVEGDRANAPAPSENGVYSQSPSDAAGGNATL